MVVANKAISVKDITEKYGESKAVGGVCFEVDEGEIFGFIVGVACAFGCLYGTFVWH